MFQIKSAYTLAAYNVAKAMIPTMSADELDEAYHNLSELEGGDEYVEQLLFDIAIALRDRA